MIIDKRKKYLDNNIYKHRYHYKILLGSVWKENNAENITFSARDGAICGLAWHG